MRKLVQILSRFKADWTNHLIGFIATVLGILIAFELQDWQDVQKERERMDAAIASIKTEIAENNKILNEGLKHFKELNGYINFVIKHKTTDSTIVCSANAWDSLRQIFKSSESVAHSIFLDQNIIKRIGKENIEILFSIPISFFPPITHSDSWEAVKSSGILNSFPIDKLTALSRLYGELNRSHTGFTPNDFVKNGGLELGDFSRITKRIELDYQIKIWRVGESYDEIMKY